MVMTFLKFIVSVRNLHCDYWPLALKSPATPLITRDSVLYTWTSWSEDKSATFFSNGFTSWIMKYNPSQVIYICPHLPWIMYCCSVWRKTLTCRTFVLSNAQKCSCLWS